MPTDRATRTLRAALGAASLALVALLCLTAIPTPSMAQSAAGYGAGIFGVNGTAVANFSLADGGSYYLGVATDDASSYVNATVTYNGSLLAETNASGSAANLVSLAPGAYVIALAGHGRAALAWDFTSGTAQSFPDNASVLAFLRPSSAHIDLSVSLGDAVEIRVKVFDDRLLPVKDANVTASGTVGVALPAGHAAAAYVSASVVAGNPQGVFGLAWTSPAPSSPTVPLPVLVVVLWIAVPVVVALLVFVALQRRRGRGP